MSRPTCRRHPRARVKRDGYYGKDKKFVRWKCMGNDGNRPHLIRPEVSTLLVGGISGACDRCERPWEETERTGLAELVVLERSLNADTDLIWRELHEWHKPRTIGAVEEALDRVRHPWRPRPAVGQPPAPQRTTHARPASPAPARRHQRLARILRQNHLARAGAPAPRREHDGAGLTLP